MRYDFLIVGAGFAGSVCAERLASAGRRVLIIDRRRQFGGNAFDCHDAAGVLIHPYGPHIFHTNSQRIFEYLSNFTKWTPYEHRVLAMIDGQLYPIPINRTTINRLYSLNLNEAEVEAFLASVRQPRPNIATSEDIVLSSVGTDLCEKFFRGYTKKQWGLDLSQLSASVAARIPVRTNDDDRYFLDRFQFMPSRGYTAMFCNMLSNPLIDTALATDFKEIGGTCKYDHLIFTGPIDSYFSFILGKLPYRSLRFEHEHLPKVKQFQCTGTINYPNDFRYTRITEFKHLTGQVHSGTSVVREFPAAEGDPYYPVPAPANEALYKQYQALSLKEKAVTFVGRLAQYRYYNMDQIVGAALATCEKLINGCTNE